MFGLGGVYVELLKDALSASFLTDVDAREMIQLLKGYRFSPVIAAPHPPTPALQDSCPPFIWSSTYWK
jgi:hypothetical protein